MDMFPVYALVFVFAVVIFWVGTSLGDDKFPFRSLTFTAFGIVAGSLGVWFIMWFLEDGGWTTNVVVIITIVFAYSVPVITVGCVNIIKKVGFLSKIKFINPVVSTALGGVILIAASILLFYIADVPPNSIRLGVTLGERRGAYILLVEALILSYWGLNSLWKVIFGKKLFEFSNIGTKGFSSVMTVKIARCGNCGRKLGGKEYRHQLRYDYCTCLQCGARIEKYSL